MTARGEPAGRGRAGRRERTSARPAAILKCAALLLLLAALPGCGRSPAPSGSSGAAGAAPTGPVRFVFPLPIEPATLNFVSGTDQSSVLVQRLVGDLLVDHDPDLHVVPRLAASWDVSADGKVLTFHLRPGVRFHDGVPCTSDDVVFTYERIMDPASKAVGRVDPFLPIEKVEAPDPATVRVTYREPYAPALRGWEIPILPAHLYRGADFAAAKENRAPVGTGPFRFVSWEAGQRIVLDANPDYWGGRPRIDGIDLRFIPSSDTALQALLTGEVDYARLQPPEWEARRTDADFQKRYREVRFVPLFYYYIAWRGDGSNPFFGDPRVRRAMTLALDREGYVRSVYHGLGRLAGSPFQGLLAGSPEPPAGPDPASAARLLDEAGWRADPKTGKRARGGVPLRFTLLVYSGGEDHVQFSQVAQQNLKALGIEMRIERLDWQTLWARLKSGRFEAALSGFMPGADPDSLYGMLHSSQIEGGQNYAAWKDPDVDAWLDAARRTLDETQRTALYRRIEARVLERQPYSYLFAPVVLAAMSRKFDGALPSPQGILGHNPGALALFPATGSPASSTSPQGR
ncbi:MAG TPA: ABC transporter substrate-binding protein [Patescibacteria group bacterium]|nr:ABC transporter substrate-binding protein [Patescibacteria group bacterium]